MFFFIFFFSFAETLRPQPLCLIRPSSGDAAAAVCSWRFERSVHCAPPTLRASKQATGWVNNSLEKACSIIRFSREVCWDSIWIWPSQIVLQTLRDACACFGVQRRLISHTQPARAVGMLCDYAYSTLMLDGGNKVWLTSLIYLCTWNREQEQTLSAPAPKSTIHWPPHSAAIYMKQGAGADKVCSCSQVADVLRDLHSNICSIHRSQ